MVEKLVSILDDMNKNTNDLLDEIINLKNRIYKLEQMFKSINSNESIDIETEAQKLASKMLKDKKIQDRANEIYLEKIKLDNCTKNIKIIHNEGDDKYE